MPDYFKRAVAHIAQLSKTPGWRAYSRQWAEDLQAHPSGAYAGLVEAVRESLKSCGEAPKNGG